MKSNRHNGYRIQSLERAFDILNLFRTDSFSEYSLKQISGKTGLHPSTAHRLINTMVYHGYMAQDPKTGHYMLGPTLLHLHKAALDNFDLRHIAESHVRDLVEKTQEQAYLNSFRGWSSIELINIPSLQPVRVVRPDSPSPNLHATASGKLYLAYGGDHLIERYINEVPLNGFTKNTITKPEELREEVQAIRSQGIAYDREEHVLGVGCIAAPIFNHNAIMVASLSISYPIFRTNREIIEQWAEDVLQCSAALCAGLGYMAVENTLGDSAGDSAGLAMDARP